MSSTPKSHPAVQRLNNAYVQVPISPLTSTRNRALSTSAHVAPSSKLKENTPLRPSLLAMQQHSSASVSFKRKLSERDGPSQILDGVIISTKKSKLSIDASAPLKSRQTEFSTLPNNASEEFPNGFVYCHQCNKKRDATDTIRCTVIERYQTVKSATVKERMCVNKYCKYCLKNRYDEDIDKFIPGKNGATCGFKCPRCRDICNCPRCRKSKGLDAIGFMPKVKAKSSPSESLPQGAKSKAQLSKKSNLKANENASARIVKALPAIKWAPLYLSLNREEVDDRIFIREFFLRFGDFLDPTVAKCHIEELELIGGRGRKQNEDNDGAAWVTDMCIKALVSSVLGVLAKDHDTSISKVIKSAVKDLRSAGMNLNKIWAVLSRMRDDISNVSSLQAESSVNAAGREVLLTFPDPSSPPVSVMSARRSLRQSDAIVVVTHSTQMIPVLVSLIHSALETTIVREEIDQGTKDARDFGRDARDATRIESERWEQERNSMEVAPKDKSRKLENRDKRTAHKTQITNIENALKIIVPSFSPRFMPLGTDDDGRVYYALFPGVAERESALEYLGSAASEKTFKLKKKCPLPSAEERMEMREWSWFVGVWGRDPAPADRRGSAESDSDSDSEADADPNAEKWWGFWQPDDITQLAQWISIKSGVDDDDSNGAESGSASSKEKAALPPRLAQYKRLATELTEYANLLRWRIRDDKCSLINRLPIASQSIIEGSSSRGKAKLSNGHVSANN